MTRSTLPQKIKADLQHKCGSITFIAGEDTAVNGEISVIYINPEFSADGLAYCIITLHSYMPGELDFTGISWRLLSEDNRIVDQGVSDRRGCFYAARKCGLQPGQSYKFVVMPEVKSPARRRSSSKLSRLGPAITVSRALGGSSVVSNRGPQVPEGQNFSVSPDRRDLLIRCDEKLLESHCPYSIVVAVSTSANGERFQHAVAVTLSEKTGSFQGSLSAQQMFCGCRDLFNDGDCCEVFSINTRDDALNLNITALHLEQFLASDPVASNSPPVQRALRELINEISGERSRINTRPPLE